MNIQRILLLSILCPALIVFGGCEKDSSANHDDHEVHDEHDDHDDHDEHNDEVVRLSQSQLAAAGVIIEPLSGGIISTNITLPAEIGLNQDTVVHVTPRVDGIVSIIDGYLGDLVQAGDLLAVLESPELGETKIAYLQAVQTKLIADSQLQRQQTISENTAKLLHILRENPLPMTLHEQAGSLRIGANKGRLLSSYAQMRAGEVNYAREQELNDKGLSTLADLLATQEIFFRTQADYMAAFEDIDFSYQLHMQEAQQSAMIADSSIKNARRRLHLLGLTQEQILQVATESDTEFARYELHAPITGRIVSKHLTPGEKVDSESSVYTIADLTTVWLNVSIYSQYSGVIEKGQHVTVRMGDEVTSGIVDYISAIVSESSRTVSARVVLENTDRSWKPGIFVTVNIEIESSHANRMVPIDAIQTYEGHTVVFVQDADGIEPVQVTLGRKNELTVELIGEDVPIGAPIVIANSFLMKAELGKSSAGHQH